MRLIDADALKRRAITVRFFGKDIMMVPTAEIDDAPTIDSVEVVRCKDCRHRDLFSCPLADNDFQKDDDFCSWGECKGGEEE